MGYIDVLANTYREGHLRQIVNAPGHACEQMEDQVRQNKEDTEQCNARKKMSGGTSKLSTSPHLHSPFKIFSVQDTRNISLFSKNLPVSGQPVSQGFFIVTNNEIGLTSYWVDLILG